MVTINNNITILTSNTLSNAPNTNSTAKTIAELSVADIKSLSTEQISSLTSAQIAGLSTAQIQGFETGQIAALSTAQITALSTSQLAALDDKQVDALSAGQISALIPFIDGKPSIHDNHAHGPTTVLRIDQDMIRKEMLRQPAMMAALLRMLASRARGLHERAVSTLLEPLEVRVARILLGLLDSYGLNRPVGILINLKISQEEFASLLGVTRQRINRELNELERRQIISMAYSQIQVINLAQLQTIAGH